MSKWIGWALLGLGGASALVFGSAIAATRNKAIAHPAYRGHFYQVVPFAGYYGWIVYLPNGVEEHSKDSYVSATDAENAAFYEIDRLYPAH